MGGRHSGGVDRVAAVNGKRRQRQTLGHGGTGAVQAEIGNSAVAQCEGCADALIQQIAAEQAADVPFLNTGLGQRQRLVEALSAAAVAWSALRSPQPENGYPAHHG